jgi:hypothetical protein
MSIDDLQSAVTQLPTEELDRFARWFEEFLADEWDRRIEADILAGRLDEAGRRADVSFRLRAILDRSQDQFASGGVLSHEEFWSEVGESEAP